MLRNGKTGWMAAGLAAAALAMGALPPARAELAVPTSPPQDCQCVSPYREYKNADTPQAQALFAAVSRSDEAAFAAALAGVDRPGDYAVDGVPLLHALLMPPRGLRSDKVYWEMAPQDAARLRDAYRAVLPARARMLDALLATRPALDDVTYESRRPPLHLAILYGTPDIMDALLAAGASPDQRGDEGRTPLEFLLDRDFEFAVRMTYLPRLVDRAAMTRMVLALFKAGASRPWARLDRPAAGAKHGPFVDADGKPRPAADFLAWLPMVEMTEGAEPLRALAAAGSKPAYGEELTALALAAYQGNTDAVSLLMALGPRTIPATGYGESGERDVWLDAAQAAVEGGHPAVAGLLLRPQMPFAQRGPQNESTRLAFTRLDLASAPIMNLAARHGDVHTLQRLLALGAPVEGNLADPYGATPLSDAIAAGKGEAARVLLAAGADPAARREGYDQKSALEAAVQAQDVAMLRDLLAAMTPESRRAALHDPERSPVARLLREPGKQGAAMMRVFIDAGYDAKTLDAGAIRQALENRDAALALMLIDAGAPVNPPLPAQADKRGGVSPDSYAYDRSGTPPLLLATASGQLAVVDALLAKGADPAALAPDGESALYWVILRRDTAMLERLMRGGAKLDDARLPRAPAPYALLNAAVASGDMALARRVGQASGQALADACLPENGEYVLLDQPGYFAQLRAAGFTGKQDICAREAGPLPGRILSQLLQSRELIAARHDTVVQVLRQLRDGGVDLDAPLRDGRTPLNAAIALGRRDLADAMLTAGASPDAADAAARSPAWVALETGQPAMLSLLARHGARFDAAAAPPGQSFRNALACQSAPAFTRVLQEAGVALPADCPPPTQGRRAGAKAANKSSEAVRVPGHYYLQGVREVGSELLLLEDGSFEYLMSYGAVDISAHGAWRSDGKQVFLDTPPVQPYSAIEGVRADTRPGEAGMLTVRVYHRGRPVGVDVAMSSADGDYGGAARQSEGADGVSAPIAAGGLRALAVFVPLPAGARWHEVDIGGLDPAARALRIDVAAPEAAAGAPLHKTFALAKDGSLVENMGGRELRYVKP